MAGAIGVWRAYAGCVTLMPGRGFEPRRGFPQEILSLKRLPVSPPGPDGHGIYLGLTGNASRGEPAAACIPGPGHTQAPNSAACDHSLDDGIGLVAGHPQSSRLEARPASSSDIAASRCASLIESSDRVIAAPGGCAFTVTMSAVQIGKWAQ
jgi:hypothetical protein